MMCSVFILYSICGALSVCLMKFSKIILLCWHSTLIAHIVQLKYPGIGGKPIYTLIATKGNKKRKV